MERSYFTRDVSGALKGVALILMFIHHFFTFPDWIVFDVDYPWIQAFANQFVAPTDLCVGLFAFLTGYFHAFSTGTLRRSLRKIGDFLLSYWLVCAVLICAAVAMGCFTLSRSGLVHELLGLQTTVMVFCWYVSFFCVVQLLLPLLYRQASASAGNDVLTLLVIPILCLSILAEQVFDPVLSGLAWYLRQWYPCVAVGCLFGKYGLFQKWFDSFLDMPGKPVGRKLLLSVILVWIGFRGCYYVQQLNLGSIRFRSYDCPVVISAAAFFAPVFLYGAANLLALCEKGLAVRMLGKIGERSMLMWFYHCLFFGCCGEYTQVLLYWPQNPILVLLNGLLLCYLAAALTEPVRTALIGVKDRLVSRMLPVKQAQNARH